MSFRAGVPKAPLYLLCEELELRKEKGLDGGVRECPGAPGEVRALLRVWGWQLGSPGLDTARSCAVLPGRFLLVGCVWGRFCLPKGNPRGAASTGWGWGDPRPLWEGSDWVGEGFSCSKPYLLP